jgi:hypothetical protein
MKKLVMLSLSVIMAFTTACNLDKPTAPPVVEEKLVISAEALADLTEAAEDARSRIAPALENTAAAGRIDRALQNLIASLNSGIRSRAMVAYTAADATVDREEEKYGDAADFSAIQLVLDRAEILIYGDNAAGR